MTARLRRARPISPDTGPALRVLGVDPGSYVAGWGVIDQRAGTPTLVECGVLRPRRADAFPDRLVQLFEGLEGVVARLEPSVLAIESVFHARHARAALQLGHARGVLLLAAARRGLPVHEYPPALVKRAISGDGAATKDQIRSMVGLLLGATVDGPLDTSDALAVALCHAQQGRLAAIDRAAGASPTPAATGRLRRRRG